MLNRCATSRIWRSYTRSCSRVEERSRSVSSPAIGNRLDGFAAASESWRQLLEALPAAVYTTDASGRITFFNEAAVELARRRTELGRDLWCVKGRLCRSDCTPLTHDECPFAIALLEDRPVRGVEVIAE